METGSIDNFDFVLNENGFRTVDNGAQVPLWDVELTNKSTNQTMLIKQMVNFLPHSNFVQETWKTSETVLNGTPHCCLDGKVSWVLNKNS
jgi:hypothetical protein